MDRDQGIIQSGALHESPRRVPSTALLPAHHVVSIETEHGPAAAPVSAAPERVVSTPRGTSRPNGITTGETLHPSMARQFAEGVVVVHSVEALGADRRFA